MKIFTNEQIREIERCTIEDEGIPMIELIERAGEGIADEIASRWQPSKRTIVFAGWGNNGADALVAVRRLIDKGFDPQIYLFNIGGKRLTAECQASKERLLDECPDAKLTEITYQFFIPEFEKDSLIVDGIFGSGLDRPLPQSFSMLLRAVADSQAEVVAIDIPSGLFGDWNTTVVNNSLAPATLTLAIEFPRLSFFIDDHSELIGEWKAISVGLSRKAMRQAQYKFYLITARDVKRMLQPRSLTCSKADFGSALICAGSYGMMGAAVLVAKGCLRSGVGKLTVYSPRCGYYVMQSSVPSAMFARDSHDTVISEITLTQNYDAVAIGPGIGHHDFTINALENFLKVANANGRPVVLDADALNCIAMRPIMLNYLPVMSVLTPHAAEFDRLFGAQTSAETRLLKAIEVAKYHNVVIVLKGRFTAVVRPDGKVHFNSSGTPALATAGSGDVLTGVIAGLMAQHYKPETAAVLGAYIHGLAGEICAETHGAYGVTSEDVADCIGIAIKHLMED
ncbi:MAG: NAD(P)H-hydrate dehydratase [Clostridium sp.]|nr:NAD(P)H-hydrate dehydratase [Clostridium sp.]